MLNLDLRNVVATAAVLLFAFVGNPAQSARPDFNRPSTFDVQHYSIRVSFDRPNKKVIGDTTVQLKPIKSGFVEFALDAVGLDFSSVTDADGRELDHRTDAGQVVIKLGRAYSPSDLISVRFRYTAVPKKGIYFVPALADEGVELHSAQIWTQGEPDEARHWFPSFDFPSDKATTEEFITADKDETVVGNGELIETIANPDGTVTTHYRMPVPHSTYLVSFVIGKYIRVEEKHRDIPLSYYLYPGKESLAKKAYGNTAAILRTYEELTGVPFTFNKYDQTMVASFQFGGMENITATTMADTEIAFADLPFGANIVEDLVSHEAAHSWFGNMVTCRNWAELWLNEGFATFMEAAYREKMYGRAQYLEKIQGDALEFLLDDAINPKRNGLFNRNANDVAALFDRPATTYSKGGAVLHTLREQVGDAAFWKAINTYLTRHRLGNVESTDLLKATEEASGQDLQWFFDQWVYGIGSPKLLVKPVWNARSRILTLTISQTQKLERLGTAAYRLPMEIEFDTPRGTRTEKLEVTRRLQTFTYKLDGKPSDIRLDPRSRIPVKTVTIRPVR
jgi:aminopeptidase N